MLFDSTGLVEQPVGLANLPDVQEAFAELNLILGMF